jgi:hypothetical protein
MGLRKELRLSADRLWRRIGPARRTRDVVLISFPKSGRTWVRFMLEAAGVRIEYSHSGAGNRSGLPFDAIAGRVSEWRDRRVVFMTRDPRDTVVSCYFQATRRIAEEARFNGSIAEFVRHPGYGIEKIARFNLHWLEQADLFRDFTVVTYEGLHAGTLAELSRVVGFATRREPRPDRIARACDAGHFDNMRKVELAIGDSGEQEKTRLGGGAAGDGESLKTRKGKVGGWGEYLSPEDIAFAEEVLTRLDYRPRLEALLSRLRCKTFASPASATSGWDRSVRNSSINDCCRRTSSA